VTAAVVAARENEWVALAGGPMSAAAERRLRERCRLVGDRLKRDLGLRQSPLSLDVVDGRAQLRIGGVAGTLNLSPELSIQVQPKFAKAAAAAGAWQESVLTILDRTRRRHFTFARSRRLSLRPALFLDHMALAYADALTQALRREPIRVYRTREETAPFLRGQFAVERQLASLLSRPDRIHCNVDYLDTDNVFNQLLHWAGRRFTSAARDARVRREVAAASALLPPVTEPPRVTNRLPLLPPAQYEQFAPALDIASTLARGFAHSEAPGRTSGYGYLVNMERLYERFIEASLKHAVPLVGADHSVTSQETRRYAEAQTAAVRSYYTRPDNVIYFDGKPLLLVDAKYKRLEDADEGVLKRPNNGDVYQLFASMAAHRARRGLLIYPTVGAGSSADTMQVWKVPLGSEAYIGAVTVDLSDLISRAELHEFDVRLATTVLGFLAAT
jgi:5-methylcytosine-specific restriction enzyme subunit McrC